MLPSSALTTFINKQTNGESMFNSTSKVAADKSAAPANTTTTANVPRVTDAKPPKTPKAAAPAAKAQKATVSPATSAATNPTKRKKKQKMSQLAAAARYKERTPAVDEKGIPLPRSIFNFQNPAVSLEGLDEATGAPVGTLNSKKMAELLAAESQAIFGVQLRSSVALDLINAYHLLVLKAAQEGRTVKSPIGMIETVTRKARVAHDPRNVTKKINVPERQALRFRPTSAVVSFIRAS